MGWLAIAAAAGFVLWRRKARSGLSWLDFVLLHGARAYSHLWHRWSCKRPVGLPNEGPVLLVANHTCSADPNFLLAASPRLISFLVAREHYDVHPWVRRLLDHVHCVAVRRNGRDPAALRRTLRCLAQGRLVCLFPEGNLSGIPRGRILPAKHGVGYLALRTGVPVYVAYIAGGPQTEQLLNSWLLPSRKAVRVWFDGPVDLSEYLGKSCDRRRIVEATNHIMERVRRLANGAALDRQPHAGNAICE